jgi:hypothetical protein
VRAQNVCCLVGCNGGLSECLGLVSAGSCGGLCEQLCSATGCFSISEASCPGAETVGCGGGAACVPTCASTAASVPTLTPWGLIFAALLLTGVAAFALRYRMRRR